MRLLIIRPLGSNPAFSFSAYLSRLLACEWKGFLKDKKDYTAADDAICLLDAPAGNALQRQWWYHIYLPLFLKRTGTQKILFLNGYCPKGLSRPGCMVIPDISYLQVKKHLPREQEFSRKHLLQSLAAAKEVITYSSAAREKLLRLKVPQVSINVLQPVPSAIFQPLPEKDKTDTRAQVSAGKEYFLADAPDAETVIHILKAFSIFKKWQNSSMHILFFLPESLQNDPGLQEKTAAYKYRSDVHLLTVKEEKEEAAIFASAYLFLHLSETDGDILPVCKARNCHTPVLAYPTETLKEILPESAFTLGEKDHESLGQTLISLYKAETLRNQMVEKMKALQWPEGQQTALNHLKTWLAGK